MAAAGRTVWSNKQKIAREKLLLQKPQRRREAARSSSPGLGLQEDVAVQKVPRGGRPEGARDVLGCKDDILVVFISHEPPKWVFFLGYINKAIASGLSHIHHLPLATISKIQIIMWIQTVFGVANSAMAVSSRTD